MTFARQLWQRVETLHAVTYFAPEIPAAAERLGLRGFWRRYFAFRAAPLGRVNAGVVEAAFFGFAPAMVARAIPAVWSLVDPADCLPVRALASADALRRLAPMITDVADDAALMSLLEPPWRSGSGLPLYAANRGAPQLADPVARLWQVTSVLREHRGDVHNAQWAAHGLSGIEVLALVAASGHGDRAQLQPARGWSDADWSDALAGLEAAGLVSGDSATRAGLDLIAAVEEATDAGAERLTEHLSDGDRARLLAALTPSAAAVAASGVLHYPNPIGLDRLPTG